MKTSALVPVLAVSFCVDVLLAGERLVVVVTELPLAAVALDVLLANLSLLLHCTVVAVGRHSWNGFTGIGIQNS